jgi:hypothetical protein
VSLRQEILKDRKEDFRCKVLKIEKRHKVKEELLEKRSNKAAVHLHPSTPDPKFLHVCLLSFVLSASPVAPS